LALASVLSWARAPAVGWGWPMRGWRGRTWWWWGWSCWLGRRLSGSSYCWSVWTHKQTNLGNVYSHSCLLQYSTRGWTYKCICAN
jgi:hypothetical protein